MHRRATRAKVSLDAGILPLQIAMPAEAMTVGVRKIELQQTTFGRRPFRLKGDGGRNAASGHASPYPVHQYAGLGTQFLTMRDRNGSYFFDKHLRRVATQQLSDRLAHGKKPRVNDVAHHIRPRPVERENSRVDDRRIEQDAFRATEQVLIVV